MARVCDKGSHSDHKPGSRREDGARVLNSIQGHGSQLCLSKGTDMDDWAVFPWAV